jgi:hypothetical protein
MTFFGNSVRSAIYHKAGPLSTRPLAGFHKMDEREFYKAKEGFYCTFELFNIMFSR